MENNIGFEKGTNKVKTERDTFNEALISLRNEDKDKISVDDILVEDNVIREKYGMRKILSYPAKIKEYIPGSKSSNWQILVGAEIVKAKGKLPIVIPQYKDCDNLDPVVDSKELDAQTLALAKEMFPYGKIEKEQLNLARNSLIQRKRIKISKDFLGDKSTNVTKPAEKIEKSKGRGRPKKS